jgi:hypothetical protein
MHNWRPREALGRWSFPTPSQSLECSNMNEVRFTAKILGCFVLILALVSIAGAQKDKVEDPTSSLGFLVIKDDNGKPVRSAAVIVHPVGNSGKQGRGGIELKTDGDGKTNFDGVPYGKLRVQVLAPGFQTFGEDYDVAEPRMNFTEKLKRPQSQYSLYGNTPAEKSDKPPAQDPKSTPPQ